MFVTKAEMKTHIYDGVAKLISEDDDEKLESAIEAAIIEAQGYCSRFDIAEIFDNESGDPNYRKDPTLAAHVKSIAKWFFIGLSNPQIDYDDAELRYNQAIKWLEKIQSGKIVPPGWPPAVQPEGADTFFHYKSNKKRRNHY